MARSLSSIWLKSMRRLSKAQSAQGRKLLKGLLPTSVRAVPVRRAKAVKPITIKPLKPLGVVKRIKTVTAPSSRAAKPARKPPAAPADGGAGLPGAWSRSYFASPPAPARRMQYWLYLPAGAGGKPGASAQFDAPLPLVVMLHGCQQTVAEFATATRMNALAERKGFAVLYPQQSAAGDAHRCWHWYKRATQQGQGDVALIAALIAQVQRQHDLDASRTYVAGLSAGAALANIVALRHPELIAAVGLHSAPIFGTADSSLSAYRAMQRGSVLSHRKVAREFAEAMPPPSARLGMPAIVIHGARDPVVRRVNMDQLAQQFEIINTSAITRAEPVRRSYPARVGGRNPKPGYQTTTYYAGRKPQLLTCEIASLAHAWSGGDESVAFSTRAGPDASLMMWSFFAHHRRTPV